MQNKVTPEGKPKSVHACPTQSQQPVQSLIDITMTAKGPNNRIQKNPGDNEQRVFLMDPREQHMCKYMFIIICFTFLKVEKGDMGEGEMLIAALSKSPPRGSKKRS